MLRIYESSRTSLTGLSALFAQCNVHLWSNWQLKGGHFLQKRIFFALLWPYYIAIAV